MNPLRVVHYLNQFFAGVGGEQAANLALQVRDGAVGPGRLLQEFLGDQATVVSTITCGDNYFSEQRDAALASLRQALTASHPAVVVAGPAFDAGRYGLACGEVCKAAQEMGIPAVTAMHPENPGIVTHGSAIIAVPTGASAVETKNVVRTLARLAAKLGRGEELAAAAEEGYLPRGLRKHGMRKDPAGKRAVDMLVAKLKGSPFQSEVPVKLTGRVTSAPALASLDRATIALINTGGLVCEDK